MSRSSGGSAFKTKFLYSIVGKRLNVCNHNQALLTPLQRWCSRCVRPILDHTSTTPKPTCGSSASASEYRLYCDGPASGESAMTMLCLEARVGPRPSKHFLTSTRGLLLFLSLASTATAPLATSNRVSCKNSGYGVATPKTIVVVSARAMGEEERERHLLKDIDIDEIRSAGRAYKAKQDRAAILAVLEDPGFCFRSGESRTKHDAYVTCATKSVGHMSCARALVPPCPPCISPPTPLAALTGFSLCTRHWALGCWWLVGRGRGPGPGAGASSSRRGFLIF
jgi:hypothetical protein